MSDHDVVVMTFSFQKRVVRRWIWSSCWTVRLVSATWTSSPCETSSKTWWENWTWPEMAPEWLSSYTENCQSWVITLYRLGRIIIQHWLNNISTISVKKRKERSTRGSLQFCSVENGNCEQNSNHPISTPWLYRLSGNKRNSRQSIFWLFILNLTISFWLFNMCYRRCRRHVPSLH